MLKAVLFDFDGTVRNTLPLCIAAFQKAITPLAGRSFSEREIVATFGPSEEGTIRALIPQFYEQGVEGYLHYYRELHSMCPAPFPGIPELLGDLKKWGAVVALVTGKGARSCRISLERYGIAEYFDAVETGSPDGPVKPEGIRAVLEKFRLAPAEALYIGDTASDITACRSVGVPAAAAAWAQTAELSELRRNRPDLLFTTVAELHAYLQKQLSGDSAGKTEE
ncbi:MAG TPA: HAD family hydrolase [Victivallis vadensis]|nr:HAD family hydrolase [Victivallis vadensis]